MRKRLAKHYECPTEFALDVLGGKWKTVILSYLKERPCRFADLRRLLPKLSEKVLTQRLRELTNQGLVTREGSVTGKFGVYVLTRRGRSLGGPLSEIYAWGLANASLFGITVGAPLKNLTTPKLPRSDGQPLATR